MITLSSMIVWFPTCARLHRGDLELRGIRRSLSMALLLVVLATAPAVVAQDIPQTAPLPSTDEAPADTADVEAERRLMPESYGIVGLVVDETRTTIGRDFYDVFYEAWQPPEGSVNYTVVVEEQPVPSLGTRLIVRINDQVAFDTRLQPRYEMIQQAALAAVRYAQRALAEAAPLSRGI
jgi:curli production assembly/transport component CsgE